MMNHTDGWMGGWTGGGMWIWKVIGVLVVVLLLVMIAKLSNKEIVNPRPACQVNG